MAEQLWFLVTNCPSESVAKKIGRALIEEGLVKSANVTAMMATQYVWEGRLVENAECQLIVKPLAGRREAVAARIEALHPFEVPAIVGWPVAYATEDYLAYNRES